MEASVLRASLLVLLSLLTLPVADALPTPGANGAVTQATLGRIFPEPLQTNDFVSYEEAVEGLRLLDEQAPERVEIVPLGPSTGWNDLLTGERATTDLFAVEVTDETSAATKATLVFFLSIHGNEKGGREGGLRVVEDLALGIGLAEEEPELLDLLASQKLVFIFANTDGWTREEVRNRADAVDPDNPYQTGTNNYARENGHFLDLNRQFPTVGYLYEGYTPLSESESQGMINYTRTLTHVVAGADIHGMRENTNLVRLLLKDGEKDQHEIYENELLAELYKERLNANPHYDAWAALPDQEGTCCGQVAEWAATFDAIGYAASGTAGAWIVQDHALDAPGYTVEYAYNHMFFDNYYPGAGAWFNDLHVEAVRDIVSVFMRFAAEERVVRLQGEGRVAVLENPFVATNADDVAAAYAGWFAESGHDDAYDLLHAPFTARPDAYWDTLAEAGAPLERHADAASLAAGLAQARVAVVPGSAASLLAGDAEALERVRAFVAAGGDLVLTDEALALAAPLGLVPADAVGHKEAYSGYTDLVARDHPLTEGLKGFPRQTYDPNPLGFAPGTSPVWFLDREAWEAAGGETVGALSKDGSGEAVVEDPATCGQPDAELPIRRDHDHHSEPYVAPGLPAFAWRPAPVMASFGLGLDCRELAGVNVGVAPLGEGRVFVFGAILPNPTEDANHPYGLDNFAVANAGNMMLLNMLGLRVAAAEGPAGSGDVSPAGATEGGSAVPGPGLALLLAALGVALLARRR